MPDSISGFRIDYRGHLDKRDAFFQKKIVFSLSGKLEIEA